MKYIRPTTDIYRSLGLCRYSGMHVSRPECASLVFVLRSQPAFFVVTGWLLSAWGTREFGCYTNQSIQEVSGPLSEKNQVCISAKILDGGS